MSNHRPPPHPRPPGAVPRSRPARYPRHPGADHRRRRGRPGAAPRRARAVGAGRFRLATALGGMGVVLYAGCGWCCPRTRASRRRRRASRAPPAAAGAPAGSGGSPTSARPSCSRRSASAAMLLVGAFLGQRARVLADRHRAGRRRPAVAAGRRGAAGALARHDRPHRPGPGRVRRRRLGVVRPGARRRRCWSSPPSSWRRSRRRLARGGARRRRRRRCSACSASASWSGRGSAGWPSDLTAERAERVRTQERADVAAHLHDSVLQTLALIQKNSSDGPLRRPARPGPGA